MPGSEVHPTSASRALLELRASILGTIAKFVDPLSPVGAILWSAGVDFINRYAEVSKELGHESVLDVGAGGRSVLASKGFDVVSIDIRSSRGTDIISSASHLPFRENTFTNVVSVDTIEHLPDDLRERALSEMIRVAREKVVVHCPLQNNEDFLGRRYDMLFQEWLKKAHGGPDLHIDEHIRNIEPHPNLFLDLKFIIRGVSNADLWFDYMRLSFLQPRLFSVSRAVAWMYFLVHKSKNTNPPYWGGVCIYKKNCKHTS